MKQTLKRWRDTSPLIEPLARALRATGLVPERAWRHLGFTGVADFTVAGRAVKMWHFGAEIENTLFWAGYGQGWEGTTLQVWERLARGSRVTFDVGANTGVFALAAQAANPAARVHAFEPLPAIAQRLADNVALNGFPITVHAVAVSDHAGTAAIRMSEAAHEYSASFEHMEWMDHTAGIEVEVPLVRLADIIAATGDRPDLIKLDVERHEPQALRGLWPGLEGGPLPTLVIEILDEATAAAVRAEIDGRGYRGFVIREGEGLSEEPLRAVPGTMNWLLLPADAEGELARRLGETGLLSHADLAAVRPGAR